MEEMLSNFQERPTHHKMFLVIGVSAVLLLIIAVSYIITSPSTKEPQAVEIKKESAVPTVIPLSTGFPNVNSNSTLRYSGQNFDLDYPNNWYLASQDVNGAEIVKIIPSDTNIEYHPVFAVYAYYSTDPSFDTTRSNLISQKFERSEIIVGGQLAERFKGEIVTSDGKYATQETDIFLEVGSKKILVKHYYISKSSIPTIENDFIGIINNLVFH